VTRPTTPVFPELASYVAARQGELDEIPPARRATLQEMADFVAERIGSSAPALLTFICTHNSRRSHMAQIWAQTAAHLHGIAPVRTFSGGTEATAFEPRAVAALRRAGFAIEPTSDDHNPVYQVRYADGAEPMAAFSKVYDHAPNPQADYCAVMTCAQADEGCPIVFGAAARIAIPFEDPKTFDGTEQEAEQYDERCRQIGREMLHAFSLVSRVSR
jgi:protein-tyrosine phosphatase/arsenate reductase